MKLGSFAASLPISTLSKSSHNEMKSFEDTRRAKIKGIIAQRFHLLDTVPISLCNTDICTSTANFMMEAGEKHFFITFKVHMNL